MFPKKYVSGSRGNGPEMRTKNSSKTDSGIIKKHLSKQKPKGSAVVAAAEARASEAGMSGLKDLSMPRQQG